MAANPYDLSATENPYLQSQGDAITRTATNNLNRNILPGIGAGAVAAGGYGGSRQGIAEGLAIGETNKGITDSLSNLYGNAYGQNQQYNLGLGNLALGNQGQNYNFYTQQRGLDQSGVQLGANLYNAGNAGYLGQGTGIYGIGNTQQQAPWTAANNAGNVFSQFSGLGGSQVQTQQGSQLGGALGGALAGAQLGKSLGGGLGLGGGGGNMGGTLPMYPGAGQLNNWWD
jgi:hypothetical protein